MLVEKGRQQTLACKSHLQIIDHHLSMSHCLVWFLGANLRNSITGDEYVQCAYSARRGHLVSKAGHLILDLSHFNTCGNSNLSCCGNVPRTAVILSALKTIHVL